MAEEADTGKRALSEKEQCILDMWPRYEDGEYVWFGDEVDNMRSTVIAVEFFDGAITLSSDFDHLHLSFGERVKRPAPKVLDADGVEIKVGDTVWIISALTDTPDEPHEVIGINRWGEVLLEFHTEGSTGLKGEYLTHARPDSWERLEEDMQKSACAYFGYQDKACDEGDGCPARGGLDCSNRKTADLIRRAKALAGVEVE